MTFLSGSTQMAVARVSGDRGFITAWKKDGFLMDSLLQVIGVNLNDNPREELLVLGKNYEREESYIYVLDLESGEQPRVLWQSDNLYEPCSHLVMAAGEFSDSPGVEIVVVSEKWIRLWRWQDSEMVPLMTVSNPCSVMEYSAINTGDGAMSYLLLTGVVDHTPDSYIKGFQLLRLGRKPSLLELSSPAVGNIRSLATGDLDGDGIDEIVVDVGSGTQGGRIELWKPDREHGRFRLITSEALLTSVAFGMDIARLSGIGSVLITAGDRGEVSIFKLEKGRFAPVSKEIRAGWGLFSVTAGDFTGNGNDEIFVLGYPNRAYLLVRR